MPLRTLKKIYIFLLFLGVCAITYSIHYYSWNRTWEGLNIELPQRAEEGEFSDWYCVTMGMEMREMGMDPYHHKVIGFGVPIDYPPLLLDIAKLLYADDMRMHFIIALSIVFAFLTTMYFFIKKSQSRLEATLVFLLTGSFSCMFGMALANTDLIIFVLMAGAVFCGFPALFALLMALAACMKLYPFFGLCAALFFDKYRTSAMVGILVSMAYFASIAGYIPIILHNVPNSATVSYGVKSIQALIQECILLQYGMQGKPTDLTNLSPLPPEVENIVTMEKLWVSIIIALLMADACKRGLEDKSYEAAAIDEKNRFAFVVFGSIYVVTFLLGSNWTYRLITLIPLIPGLIEFMKQKVDRRPALALACMCAAMYASYFFPQYKHGIRPDDIINLTATTVIAYIVVFFLTLLMRDKLLILKQKVFA